MYLISFPTAVYSTLTGAIETRRTRTIPHHESSASRLNLCNVDFSQKPYIPTSPCTSISHPITYEINLRSPQPSHIFQASASPTLPIHHAITLLNQYQDPHPTSSLSISSSLPYSIIIIIIIIITITIVIVDRTPCQWWSGTLEGWERYLCFWKCEFPSWISQGGDGMVMV
jgi:hypothetical protein